MKKYVRRAEVTVNKFTSIRSLDGFSGLKQLYKTAFHTTHATVVSNRGGGKRLSFGQATNDKDPLLLTTTTTTTNDAADDNPTPFSVTGTNDESSVVVSFFDRQASSSSTTTTSPTNPHSVAAANNSTTSTNGPIIRGPTVGNDLII